MTIQDKRDFTPSPEFPFRQVKKAEAPKSHQQFVEEGTTVENPWVISSSPELAPRVDPPRAARVISSRAQQESRHIPSSPELCPQKRRKEAFHSVSVMPPVANQNNDVRVTNADYHLLASTPELLAALEQKEGVIDYRNGTYEGQLEELRPHGKGVWHGADGSYYEGDWVSGEFEGVGSYRDARDNFYNGGWKKGKRDGEGVYLFRNGDSYQGEWCQGKMHGKGEACYARTGDLYRGDWQDNLRHGHGTFFVACNKADFLGKYITLQGEYRQNLRQGTFIITTPQGSQCELSFQNNNPVPGSSCLIKFSQDGAAQFSLDQWIKKAH